MNTMEAQLRHKGPSLDSNSPAHAEEILALGSFAAGYRGMRLS